MSLDSFQPLEAVWEPPTVEAPAETAAPAETTAPPAGPELAPGVTAAPPAEWAAATGRAAQAEYGDMPWGEEPAGPTIFDQAAAAGLDEEGIALMQQLADMGKLSNVGGDRTLGEEIVWRLENDFVEPDVANVLMRQLIDPDNNIGQFGPNTCVAATNQKAMAQASPNLYFVTAADFVKAGQGNLPNGEVAHLSGENREALAGLDLSAEQRVNGAFQGALMDHANGADAYNVVTDVSTKPDGTEYKGLSYRAARDLNQAALGAPLLDGQAIMDDWTYQMDQVNQAQQQMMYDEFGQWGYQGYELQAPALMDVVQSHLQAAQNKNFPGVMVSMNTPEGSQHMVMVSKVDTRSGTVTVTDATGAPRQMSMAEFTNNIYLGAQSNDDGGIGGWTGWTPTQTTTTGRGRG